MLQRGHGIPLEQTIAPASAARRSLPRRARRTSDREAAAVPTVDALSSARSPHRPEGAACRSWRTSSRGPDRRHGSRSSTSPRRCRRTTPILAAAAGVRPDGDASSWRRSAATTSAGRPGTGTTSAPASTPAPTSTRRTTGSPARTATTSRRCPRGGSSARRSSSTSRPQAAADPDFLSRSTTSAPGRPSTARCPAAAGCCAAPDGTPGRRRRTTASTPTRPARTRPGMSAECARWVAEESPVHRAWASRRSAPTPGPRTPSTRRSRATRSCSGNGKYGLTQLQNLAAAAADRRGGDRRPAADRRRVGLAGAGAGPRRALSAVATLNVAEAVGRRGAGRGPAIDHVFGVVGSGNFHVTNALVDGRRPFRGGPARERRGDDGRRATPG